MGAGCHKAKRLTTDSILRLRSPKNWPVFLSNVLKMLWFGQKNCCWLFGNPLTSQIFADLHESCMMESRFIQNHCVIEYHPSLFHEVSCQSDVVCNSHDFRCIFPWGSVGPYTKPTSTNPQPSVNPNLRPRTILIPLDWRPTRW